MSGFDSPLVLAILLLVAVLIVAVAVVVSRYRIAGPNEAIIVTGSKGKQRRDTGTGDVIRDLTGQKVVMGAGVFVVPFVKKAFSVDLSARRIPLQVRSAVSAHGIQLNLEGVAIVKVGGTSNSLVTDPTAARLSPAHRPVLCQAWANMAATAGDRP